VVQYCQHEQFKKKVSQTLLHNLQALEEQYRAMFASALQKGSRDSSLRADARQSLNGVLGTIHGALHRCCWIQNHQQENQLESIESTTNYILSSVGSRVTTKLKTDTSLDPSPLELEMSLESE